MLKVENEKKLRQIVHLKKELHTIKKRKKIILPLIQHFINMVIKFQF